MDRSCTGGDGERDHHKAGVSARTGPHGLPLARIKKIMKRSVGETADGGARIISGEAPVVFSKARAPALCLGGQAGGQGSDRAKKDIATVVQNTDLFNFLVDVIMADAGVAASTRRPTSTTTMARQSMDS
ncbi:hypothetical protein C2845_PM06G01790 [Panicum miliaceum]|uniref:Uncharacterized protein n=1 Tax=Panicum miliaceum TaxID=4540 RepID=A0A3L6R8H1_PANMI|nr:hypothetical protein C2845_PM06G01790 [Panicum miliaceum]